MSSAVVGRQLELMTSFQVLFWNIHKGFKLKVADLEDFKLIEKVFCFGNGSKF